MVSASVPDWLIPIRYCFSLGLCIFGIAVAVGLLARKEVFRKLGIGLGVFTLLTIYWKHQPATFFRHTEYLTEKYAYSYSGLMIDFSVFAKDALITLYVSEFIFWGFLYFILQDLPLRAIFIEKEWIFCVFIDCCPDFFIFVLKHV